MINLPTLITVPVPDAELQRAAVDWQAFLGHPIEVPGKSRWPCGGFFTVGCYSYKDKTIALTLWSKVPPTESGCSVHWILMHELGHSLGYKHSTGSFMEAECGHSTAFPSILPERPESPNVKH